MKLYFTKGTCSFAPHVGLREAGLEFELAPVNLREKTLADGGDYLAVNPRGYVPLLERDDGGTLSECAVILQWIGDRVPESGLLPAAGTEERYRVQEWLSFVGGRAAQGPAAAVHGAYSRCHAAHREGQARAQARLPRRGA